MTSLSASTPVSLNVPPAIGVIQSKNLDPIILLEHCKQDSGCINQFGIALYAKLSWPKPLGVITSLGELRHVADEFIRKKYVLMVEPTAMRQAIVLKIVQKLKIAIQAP